MSRFRPPFTSQDTGCFCCPPSTQSPSLNASANAGEMRGDDCVFPADGISDTLFRLNLSQEHKPNSAAPTASSSNDCQQHPCHNLDPSNLNSLMQNIHINHQNVIAGNNGSKDLGASSLPLLPQDYHGVSPIENSPFPANDTLPSASVDVRMSFVTLQSRQLGNRFPPNKSYLSTSAPSVQSRPCEDIPVQVSSSSTNMDLDLALDELGMLSTITKSRRDYLLETRGTSSTLKRERRLRSKSESSPNLSTIGRVNGVRVVQADSNYVTNISSSSSSSVGIPNLPGFPLCDLATLPVRSQSVRMEYRNPDVLEASSLVRRRRSVPRMSRIRSGRYNHRSSRCPYKVPNRLCNSMQEGDFDLEGFQNYQDVFSSSSSLPNPSQEPSIPSAISLGSNVVNGGNDSSSSPSSFLISSPLSPCTLTSPSQHHHAQSKSNTNSPIKPYQDQPLVRSLSVEDLHSTTPARKLALLFDVQAQTKQREEDEAHFEQIASQFTDLHMS